MGYNVIGDIAGRADELFQLLKLMPDDEPVSVGDMIDRHDQSREVVEFFMKNGKAIYGNHEDLMLNDCRNTNFYPYGCWIRNGGGPTLASFAGTIPEEVLTWVEYLPKYLELEGCLISHAFVDSIYDTPELACNFGCDSNDWPMDYSIIWNRLAPISRDKYVRQIAGHNSQMGLMDFSDKDGIYATCIDDSRNRKLTGIHIPSFKIYQVEYI